LTDRGMLPDWGLANPYQRLTALACVLLVALVALPRPATGRPSILVAVLESRPLFLAGLASYSLFLWHEPVTRLLAEHGLTVGGRAGLVTNIGVVAVVSGVLAAATYRLVERPALARKVGGTVDPRRAKPTTGVSIALDVTPSHVSPTGVSSEPTKSRSRADEELPL
jgi:peptidoglycan/LPS O-acetylase OafA/YrhL